uniref:Uncharacterized protein n=1 Tax=Zea mays TaxID=4577 RepID=C4J8M5_MAIZE|nr:unknown [Zea mays]
MNWHLATMVAFKLCPLHQTRYSLNINTTSQMDVTPIKPGDRQIFRAG